MASSHGLERSTSIDKVLHWLVTAFLHVPHQITHTFLKYYFSKIVPKQPQKDPQSTWEKDAEARWLRQAGSWRRASPEGNRESSLSFSHPCRYKPPWCWISSRFRALRQIHMKIYYLRSSWCGSFPGWVQSGFVNIATDYSVPWMFLYL